ncbi:TPA: hypothetical protein I7241_03255 [Vibrio vulnificus]|uniref:hypothetical protein n=1 Tax=Vibrio sp. 05-20-BW147 TaxID=2575834 RepID=UPI001593CAE1|nr:hypothetical protein [Vibrio sp. 05-20-BW147]NVC64305.1 hypothetical protein [Vibrio sp. 05-20-BW147]HAS6346980.1 hypothetical protein [Vibrio vulnificus]
MKKIISLMAVLLSVFLLNGCVGTVRTYEGEKKPNEEIAVIQGKTYELGGASYHVYFASYADLSVEERKFKDVGDAVVGYPQEIHMLPGEYLILTRCHVGSSYAFPAVKARVKAGEVYEVQCGPVRDKLNTVGAVIKSAEPKVVAQEQ